MVIKMADFTLFNRTISIPNAYIRYRNMQHRAGQASVQVIKEFNHWYDRCFGIEAVLEKLDEVVYGLIDQYVVDELYGRLASLEIYDISRGDYIRQCVDMSYLDESVERIEYRIMEITQDKNAMKAYREARKAYRGKFIGGGFGISGAIKGSVKAGALNATTGMAHSLVNTLGDAGSSIAAAAKKAGLYNSDTKDSLVMGIRNSIFEIFDNHMSLVNTYYSGYYESGFDVDRASALFENAKKYPDKRKDLLIQAVLTCPTQWILDYIFDNYSEERMHVCNIGNCFSDLESYWTRFEKVFQSEYETAKQQGSQEVEELKETIYYAMQECGVEESGVYDQINYDELVRITEEYLLCTEEVAIKRILHKFMDYDAPDIQKKQVIKEKGIWEIAGRYGVEYSQEDVDNILSRYYFGEAKQNEEKAQEAKKQIRVVMNALNVTSSQVFDQLEKDCIARLCPNITEASEEVCQKMTERIAAYDALEENKQPFVDEIKKRIDTIWTQEDAAIFDKVYLRTNLHDVDEIRQAIEFVKQKGRTENAQKYINALETCSDKNIKAAQKYPKKMTTIYEILGIGLTFAGVILTLMHPAFCLIFFLGIVLWNAYNRREKYWYLLTINETNLHKDLFLPDKTK